MPVRFLRIDVGELLLHRFAEGDEVPFPVVFRHFEDAPLRVVHDIDGLVFSGVGRCRDGIGRVDEAAELRLVGDDLRVAADGFRQDAVFRGPCGAVLPTW